MSSVTPEREETHKGSVHHLPLRVHVATIPMQPYGTRRSNLQSNVGQGAGHTAPQQDVDELLC